MVEGKIDWVSQQAPDSHDWLEYMLTADRRGRGFRTRFRSGNWACWIIFSIGEISVDMAYKKLVDGNRLGGRHDAETKIGKDGKVSSTSTIRTAFVWS